ncbi:hypothetical protein ACTXG5_27330 [Mycobacterium sp. Dal123C01]|uniref:hypothetical protein n=1 Tax=Mycobacterium sp. Dal123C01 TaxID=3457577 RepID=UPI00403E7C78
MTPADDKATTDFFTGHQQSLAVSGSNTKHSTWRGYVQSPPDALPADAAVNLSLLGRVAGGVGNDTRDVHTENAVTGLILRKLGPTLAHVGTRHHRGSL